MGMKRLVAFGALLVLTRPAEAQVSSAGVTWTLHVFDILGDHVINVAYAGGTLPNTGMTTCVQQRIRNFTDQAGNPQQEIDITCSVGISSKVTLVQTCYSAQRDRSFGAMKVEDAVNNFTISLACSR